MRYDTKVLNEIENSLPSDQDIVTDADLKGMTTGMAGDNTAAWISLKQEDGT